MSKIQTNWMRYCKKINKYMLSVSKTDTFLFVNCIQCIFIHTVSYHSTFIVERKYHTHLIGFLFFLSNYKDNIVVICSTQYQFSALLNHKVAWSSRHQHFEVIHCISAFISYTIHVH